MAVFLFHGDDNVKSRDAYISAITEAKLKDMEIVTLSGKQLDLTTLKQAMESHSLFADERLVAIEELLSRIQSAAKKELLTYLGTQSSGSVAIWEGKKVDATSIKLLGKAKVQEFKLPQVLFSFLDDITPHKAAYNVKNLRLVLAQQPADMVLSLLQKRVRQLLLAAAGPEVIRAIERTAEWQLKKIERQAQRFTEQQLRDWYADMLRFDYARKTGKTSRSVEQQLEFWLLRL